MSLFSVSRPLALALAISVSLGGWAFAQVGPQAPASQQPQSQGMVQDKVVNGISKLFNKKKKDDAEATAPTPDDGNAKPVVLSPDEAARLKPVKPSEQVYKRPPMLTQPELTSVKIEPAQVDPENPPVFNHPMLDDPNNPLGFTDAENRLRAVSTKIEANQIGEARSHLVPLRQWLIDSTEAHIKLYQVLQTVPSAKAQAELEKQLALEFAQLRDHSMLEMGKVYIAEKDYGKAVKELIEVIKSQPRSKIGIQSYELLQEIGFTQKLQLAQ